MDNIEQLSRSIYYQLADLAEISAIYSHNDTLIFRARPRGDAEKARVDIAKRLKANGFNVSFREDMIGLILTVTQAKRIYIPKLNVLLFIATLLTMFFAPALMSMDFGYFNRPGAISEQLQFTIALIAILLFHEFGHYLAGRRRGVLMSLPYFIPAPNFVGTFGAIIKSRTPFSNRRDLMEVGATGPIAGFVVAVIVLGIGLYQSEIVQTDPNVGFALGDSLLIKFLSWLIIGPIPDGFDFMLSPIAFAGWVGLLVTMINLLPIGQLDGGHILYALFGRYQQYVGKIFLIIMIVLGFWWPGWWLFGALVFIFGIKHPPTINDSEKLPRHARIMGYISLVIFIISFIPAPFKMG